MTPKVMHWIYCCPAESSLPILNTAIWIICCFPFDQYQKNTKQWSLDIHNNHLETNYIDIGWIALTFCTFDPLALLYIFNVMYLLRDQTVKHCSKITTCIRVCLCLKNVHILVWTSSRHPSVHVWPCAPVWMFLLPWSACPVLLWLQGVDLLSHFMSM